ncbi:Hsp20/alpha crystallin family protein [Caproiciproducens galactitolivorans]|uniref:18 kDa heat shock protein n=1 Tax=Caproiciproducens galactitolivorans TaxID=642589 RepID=A0A4Z0YG15_9FIRM|nr:Hsp20/alpha crystallin family protein [Caproiciproducens galactitolivorans]QEY34568.1 Hsp20/alpha crystallin family protein [Caproiciproducens galactitolivorans]TGJ77643.1 18 kDa heat shock protein [Caproiciproducens galactitolivorans]
MFDLMPFGRRENSLFNYIDNMEKNFFGDFARSFSTFRTDVIDEGDRYVLKAELPGFNKEDIKIDIEGSYLTVSAQHSDDTEEKRENYVRRERRYGSFARSFDISDIKSNEITAEYTNGILSLNLPKKEGTVPESRRIEIK